ncbi:hypothetical protein PC116_g16647 [Phytophthora cactorum]|nr:hypothetical protein PC116_g16647 [Phytophthora cactorum]
MTHNITQKLIWALLRPPQIRSESEKKPIFQIKAENSQTQTGSD